MKTKAKSRKKTVKKVNTKPAQKTQPQDYSPKVKCPDCGLKYTAGAPHVMFCSAHTCSECGTSFGAVLPVYDSRPEARDEDGNPCRLCDNCVIEREESEDAEL